MKYKFITDPQDPFGDPFDPVGTKDNSDSLSSSVQGGGNPFAALAIGTYVAPPASSEAGSSSVATVTNSAGSTVPGSPGVISFNLAFDSGAPASFQAGIEQAASILSATFYDKITVNLTIHYSGTGGGAFAGPAGGLVEDYPTIMADLINHASPGDTTFNALPSAFVQGQTVIAVWDAQLKALGLIAPNDTSTTDGTATFATDINPNLLVGVALHELTHARGRLPYGPPYGSEPDIFDLFRFTSVGTQLIAGGNTAAAAFFSLDGGNKRLADFGQTSDPSDFLNSGVQGPNDPFNEFYGNSTLQSLTAADTELLDALGFHIAHPPTISVQNDSSASRGQHIALSSLVTIADPSGVGYQKLELWDSNGTVAAGQFVVNGVAQTGGHEIDVAPANAAGTVFNAGTAGGSDTLWARLLLNDGTLSGWQQFSVTIPMPTLAVYNDPTATGGQHVALSSLVTIADPSGVGYQKLELWDTNGTVAGGQFVVNGVVQTGGHEIDVAPANVTSTVFNVGTLGGTDTLFAWLLQDDGTPTAWMPFTVTAPFDRAPVVTVSNLAAAHGQ